MEWNETKKKIVIIINGYQKYRSIVAQWTFINIYETWKEIKIYHFHWKEQQQQQQKGKTILFDQMTNQQSARSCWSKNKMWECSFTLQMQNTHPPIILMRIMIFIFSLPEQNRKKTRIKNKINIRGRPSVKVHWDAIFDNINGENGVRMKTLSGLVDLQFLYYFYTWIWSRLLTRLSSIQKQKFYTDSIQSIFTDDFLY